MSENSQKTKELFKAAFEKMPRLNPAMQPLSITDIQLDLLCLYWENVKKQNQVMNLTRVTEDQSAAALHFADSLAPLFYSLLTPGASLCDLGSGAGFPGLPLAILRPDLKIVLVDSLQKRVAFLESCVKELQLQVRVCHARAEDFGQSKNREQFDFVTARAVARMQVLSEWTLPLCKVGGKALYYKGPALAQELESAQNAIKTLGGGQGRILPYLLPEQADSHQLYVLEKTRPTPKPYPRKGSAKKPLS